MSIVSTFSTAILPIVAIAAVGFLLGRSRGVDVDPLNTITVYVLAPALIAHSLATTRLGGAVIAKVLVGTAAYLLAMTVIAEVVGRLAGLSEPLLSAFVLVCVYPNSGNFGIPLSNFAFGEVGRSTAVLFLAGQSVLVYTLGVYVASRGGGSGGLAGVRRVFEVPLVYAVLLAVAARWAGVVPPAGSTAMGTLKLVGDAAIPVMLLILGAQLAEADVRGALDRVGLASAMRLFVAPAVGAGIAVLIGFGEPTVARTFVLEAATPAAITPLILVIEFGDGDRGAAEFVTAAVLVTTVASVATLTALIALLEAGALG